MLYPLPPVCQAVEHGQLPNAFCMYPDVLFRVDDLSLCACFANQVCTQGHCFSVCRTHCNLSQQSLLRYVAQNASMI